MKRFALCTVLLFGLVSACGDDSTAEPTHGEEPEAAAATPAIASLPQVDIAALNASEKRLWATLVNDLNSPCGEPVSVARCVQEQRACRACVPAARYLARLVGEGLDRTELREAFQTRYSSSGRFDLEVDGSPVRGAPMARVTLVEFADFECAHCGAAEPVLRQILEEFEGQVRLVFKYFPLPSHSHANDAAASAAAADLQGKFWEMHDLLFQNQARLEPQDVIRYAGQAGLDVGRWGPDRETTATAQRIQRDIDLGHRVGVEGTPTLFVNGRKYPGNIDVDGLRAYIREELDQ